MSVNNIEPIQTITDWDTAYYAIIHQLKEHSTHTINLMDNAEHIDVIFSIDRLTKEMNNIHWVAFLERLNSTFGEVFFRINDQQDIEAVKKLLPYVRFICNIFDKPYYDCLYKIACTDRPAIVYTVKDLNHHIVVQELLSEVKEMYSNFFLKVGSSPEYTDEYMWEIVKNTAELLSLRITPRIVKW